MNVLKYVFTITLSLLATVILAQNEKAVLTLSDGVFNEFHDNDSIVRIGSAFYNVNTNEVVGITFTEDLISDELEEELMGRWLAVDPLASRYPNVSPYVFAINIPILVIDFDGQAIISSDEFNNSNYGATYQKLMSSSATFKALLTKYENSGQTKKRKDNQGKPKDDFNLYLTFGKTASRMKITYLGDLSKQKKAKARTFYEGGSTTFTNVPGQLGTASQADINLHAFSQGSKELNEIGRASILIHEAVHAYIDATVFMEGEFVQKIDQHNKYASLMSDKVLTALKEYNTKSNLGYSESDLKKLSVMGLQGTDVFNAAFDLDKTSDTYKDDLTKAVKKLDDLMKQEKKVSESTSDEEGSSGTSDDNSTQPIEKKE